LFADQAPQTVIQLVSQLTSCAEQQFWLLVELPDSFLCVTALGCSKKRVIKG
jgi:hypothetical protein